ncbi:MAG: hypothetical protein RSF75_00515, partial [Acidaminococcaceae bacterium]
MLEKILKITIVVVFAMTGLIMMELMTPYFSGVFDYDLESTGVFGITLATTFSGVAGVLIFGGVGYVLSPAIIYSTMRFTEVIVLVLAKAPTSNIIIAAMGVIIGLI